MTGGESSSEDPIENEFAVESPNQLRGTITDQVLDVTEKDCRREIAREWEQLQRRIEIVGFAIREWNFLAPATERGGAGNDGPRSPHVRC